LKKSQLEPMEKENLARSIVKVKKTKLRKILMRNLVTGLAKRGVSHNEKNKLLWHLNMWYEEERWKKKGLIRSKGESQIPLPLPWTHEMPLRMKLLPQIYQKTSSKFREPINFLLYLDLLGQGACDLAKELGETCERKKEARSTLTAKMEALLISWEENAHSLQHELHDS